jgi:uncharacterized protein YjbI with pentapeptide repeats
MSDPAHLAILDQGVDAWNAWRQDNPGVRPDLRGANLHDAYLRRLVQRVRQQRRHLHGSDLDLQDIDRAEDALEREIEEAEQSLLACDEYGYPTRGADLRGIDFAGVDLIDANLLRADLTEADLQGARLHRADLSQAVLRRAVLNRCDLTEANLSDADLEGAQLAGARLDEAMLRRTRLARADLEDASLAGANLRGAQLNGTRLVGTDLGFASLVEADLRGAELSGCRVYGIAAWALRLDAGTRQKGLIITPQSEPPVTADDVEVAQFLNIVLHNEKMQHAIDSITTKVVLILGRFSVPERKAVLDVLRTELQRPGRDYIPVVFDFSVPRTQTTVETIMTLARMARFVIADLSDAKSVLQELMAIVPWSPKLAVQPLIVESQAEPGMLDFFRSFRNFLDVLPYRDLDALCEGLDARVLRPVEAAVVALRGA